MKQRHTPYVTLALVALATAFLAAAAEVEPLKNDESRTQGFRLDAKHELRMEDHNGAVRLNLLTRTREAPRGIRRLRLPREDAKPTSQRCLKCIRRW